MVVYDALQRHGRKFAQQARQGREDSRDVQNTLEMEVGQPGLFAFINTRLGDGAAGASQAAGPAGLHKGASQVESPSRYFSDGSMALRAAAVGGKRAVPQKDQNRRELVSQQVCTI